MTKTCKNYPWQALQLTFSPQTVKNLWNPYFARQFFFFFFFQSGRDRHFIAEKADRSIGTIVPFATSNNSRRENETCWLLDVRNLTNPPDLVISSPNTKGSVIPQRAEWNWSSEDSANVSQGRTNVNIQSTPVEWAVKKGGGVLPAMQGSSPEFQQVLYVKSISAFLFGITSHRKMLSLSW